MKQDMERRCGHGTMVKAIQFIEVYIVMAYEFHHPVEIRVFFVPAQHLHFPIAGDEY